MILQKKIQYLNLIIHETFTLKMYLKGYSTFFFFLEIGSFYHSPRVEQLSFTIFESIQPIF